MWVRYRRMSGLSMQPLSASGPYGLRQIEPKLRIPEQTGQRFRTKLDTDSGPKWTAIAVADGPRSGCSPDRFGGSDPRSGATRDSPPLVGPFSVTFGVQPLSARMSGLRGGAGRWCRGARRAWCDGRAQPSRDLCKRIASPPLRSQAASDRALSGLQFQGSNWSMRLLGCSGIRWRISVSQA